MMKAIVLALALIEIVSCAPSSTQVRPADSSPRAAPAPRATDAIRILRSNSISADDPVTPHIETFGAVDPANPRHMLATSMVVHGNAIDCVVYVTSDGGNHWIRSTSARGVPNAACGGDPDVYFNPDGMPLFVYSPHFDPTATPKILVSRSLDGGRTWEKPLALPYRDREYIAFDGSNSLTSNAMRGNAYLIGNNWQQSRTDGQLAGDTVLSISHDGGVTFPITRTVTHDQNGPNHEAQIGSPDNAVVTSGGVFAILEIIPADFQARVKHLNTPLAHLLYRRMIASDDGGLTFGAMRDAPPEHDTSGYRQAKSSAETSITIDPSSGAFRDRIYAAWADFEGGRFAIKVTATSDLGTTWHTVVADDVISKSSDSSNPAIAVNKDGVVAVVWKDRRDDPHDACWRLYGAISTDGGEHFSRNVRMSKAPTCVNAPSEWKSLSSVAYVDDILDPIHPTLTLNVAAFLPVRFPNGGDTLGLVADSDGVFHAIWNNGEAGGLQLWQTDFVARPVAAQKTSKIAGPQRLDLSTQLRLETGPASTDFEHHVINISVRIFNPTKHAVRAPLQLSIAQFTTEGTLGLRNLHAKNADNGKRKDGADWLLQTHGLLEPGMRTPYRILQFGFDGGVPQEPDGYFLPKLQISAARTTN